MAIKRVVYDGEPMFLKGCHTQIGKKIVCKWIWTTPLILMAMVDMIVDSMRNARSPWGGHSLLY